MSTNTSHNNFLLYQLVNRSQSLNLPNISFFLFVHASSSLLLFIYYFLLFAHSLLLFIHYFLIFVHSLLLFIHTFNLLYSRITPQPIAFSSSRGCLSLPSLHNARCCLSMEVVISNQIRCFLCFCLDN